MQAQETITRSEIDAGRWYPPFRRAAVLGAGTMGAQIAAHLANAGLQVDLLDMPSTDGSRDALAEKGLKQAQRAKPDPFFTKETAKRIRAGNFEDHFGRVGEADWVIEVVVERMDIKRQMAERIEAAARPDAVISTNTSGLPIAEIVEGRSASFRRRFLGTHFFNPPRYLKLLELIPTEDTDAEVLGRVAHFGRMHLGKGIVVAKDRPYFIGNRIGVYGMMQAVAQYVRGDYSMEEIEALTGPIVGRPKSATFRTADLVGLDVLLSVADNLYEGLPEDESREVFRAPDVLRSLVKKGALGEKTKSGFYKKEGKDLKVLDPSTGAYRAKKDAKIEGMDAIWKAGGVKSRIKALFEDRGRAGAFVRPALLDLLAYSARRIPEITDNPADLDRAIRWGFGWDLGPFEIWDAIGMEEVVAAMQAAEVDLPSWVGAMQAEGHAAFYLDAGEGRSVYIPAARRYADDPQPADELRAAVIGGRAENVLWKNEEAALLDMGEGVALYEFRSKANSLGQNVMQGLMEAIGRVEKDGDLLGLVVGNDGKNFSVGANLGEAAMAAAAGQFGVIEQFVEGFQATVQRIRYAAKPVVVAVHGRALGGGCEMVMASPQPVAAAESYIGLVELGVGLIPAGTGTMRLAALAASRAPNGHPSEIQPWIQQFFENVAMARVATSAREAQVMGFLAPHARVVMNAERRLFVAREEVIRLAREGYRPPPLLSHIMVLGRPTRAALEVGVRQYRDGGFISEYDMQLALELAYVLTGGDLSAPQEVPESYLIELERETFMRLLGEKKTQERITNLLLTGKPLRN